MAKTFIVDPAFLAKHPRAFTVVEVPGQKPKRVALGETTIEVPAGAGGPDRIINVPAPTQAELKILFERGDRHIIQVDVVEHAEPEIPEEIEVSEPAFFKKRGKKNDSE